MDSSSGAGGSGSGSKKSSDSSSKKGGKGSKQSKRQAPDELWNDGNPPDHLTIPVDNYLVDIPPKAWTNTDPSVDVLCLLRYVEQALRLAVRCLTIQMLLAYVLN